MVQLLLKAKLSSSRRLHNAKAERLQQLWTYTPSRRIRDVSPNLRCESPNSDGSEDFWDEQHDHLIVQGNLLTGDHNACATMLPMLLPCGRTWSAMPAPALSQSYAKLPELAGANLESAYTSLAKDYQTARRMSMPDNKTSPHLTSPLRPSGAYPLVLQTWMPRMEEPRPPHDVQVRIRLASSGASTSSFAGASTSSISQARTLYPDSSQATFLTLDSISPSEASTARAWLSKGDWSSAADADLMATWPGPWKQAANRRTRIVRRRFAKDSKLSRVMGCFGQPVDLAAPSARKTLVLATRLVQEMSYSQPETTAAIIDGFQRFAKQSSEQPHRFSMSSRQWTVTMNKTVPKKSKAGEVLDHEGRALLDRSHFQSLLADVAGVEGSLQVRAQLAQAGASIDNLYDHMLGIQTDLHENYDLTRQDARKALCFEVCSVIITAFARSKLSAPAVRELFDEFAGSGQTDA